MYADPTARSSRLGLLATSDLFGIRSDVSGSSWWLAGRRCNNFHNRYHRLRSRKNGSDYSSIPLGFLSIGVLPRKVLPDHHRIPIITPTQARHRAPQTPKIRPLVATPERTSHSTRCAHPPIRRCLIFIIGSRQAILGCITTVRTNTGDAVVCLRDVRGRNRLVSRPIRALGADDSTPFILLPRCQHQPRLRAYTPIMNSQRPEPSPRERRSTAVTPQIRV